MADPSGSTRSESYSHTPGPSGGLETGRLLIHSDLRETVREIRQANIVLPEPPSELDISVDSHGTPWQLPLLERVEEEEIFLLDNKLGETLATSSGMISAYDESIRKYAALEGTAYLVCHSLVSLGKTGYLPLNFLTFRFYTPLKEVPPDRSSSCSRAS